VHVAVAVGTWGVQLGHHSFATDAGSYQQLIAWATRFGPVEAFGIEGTGSY